MDPEFYEILDTIVKIGLGATIGGSVAIYIEHFKFKKELEYRHFTTVKKPVLDFIEDLLNLISQTYWEKTDETDKNEADKNKIKSELLVALKNLRIKDSIIEAKISSLNNNHVTQSWKELNKKYATFKFEIEKKGLGIIGDYKKEIEEKAGEVIKYLSSKK